MNLSRYRKLIPAVVGLLAVIAGPDVLALTDDTEALTQAILAALTLLGIWGVPNQT